MYDKFLFLVSSSTEINKTFIQKIISEMGEDGLVLLKRIIISIIIFIIGQKVIHFIVKVMDKYFNRVKIELSVSGFLIALTRAALYIILITSIVVKVIGIGGSTVVAVLGSAGLSIGLALQGGLSNFAGGVLILILKPFRVGDYIITGGFEGTVTAIDIFYTKLLTFDNKSLVMPNGTLSNTNIINVTNEPSRRLDLAVTVDYSENIQRVKDILTEIVQNNEKVLKDQEMRVYVNNLERSGVNIGIRVWVANENFWIVKWELLEEIKNSFDKNHIIIPIFDDRLKY